MSGLEPSIAIGDLRSVRDEDGFDWRRYLLSVLDPEERARTIRESGWAGHPDIEDRGAQGKIGSGKYQNVLAWFRKPPPPPKRQ